MNSICIFTIASKNYTAHARTLFSSIRGVHKSEIDCFLVLADEIDGAFEKTDESFKIVEAKDIGISGFIAMSFMYDILEFNTALKPFIMKYFSKQGYKKIIYLDPDIMVFNSLDYIFDLLEKHQILLTPHTTAPHSPEETVYPIDRSHLISGAFNLGFIAITDGNESLLFLDWWSERLKNDCFFEVEKGLFTDQKWLDLALCFFESIYVIRHKGCNMAYWNLHERTLDPNMLVNGKDPLIFYHFSGLDINNLNSISRIQDKYTLENREDLRGIFDSYKEKMMANGYERAKSWKYQYSYYDNGVRIGPLARRLYSLVREKYVNPFDVGPGTFYEQLRNKRLLEKEEEGYYVSKITKKDVEAKLKYANIVFKFISFILGADRYSQLMRYLRYVSVLRHQDFLVK